MRYEKKYRIDGLPEAWVLQAIRMHPAGFQSLFPPRQVNNIYFDTPDLDAFQQNTAGVVNRRKHRLRWYGTDYATLHDPVFEIKIKDGEMGTKENTALPTTQWTSLRNTFKQIDALKYLPQRPVLVNRYQRTYWGSQDGRFRITVDQNLQFAPFSWVAPPGNSQFLTDQAIVLELKYDLTDDNDAQFIFQHLPFRQTKNSKYVTGINLIYG
ncbi:MAG: polyphosphate polymerase domain-containing protein [Saprospiraceae bacterium]